MSAVDEGWIYYAFRNPATDREEPKASYVKSIDWDGNPAAIGAGIYRRDIPGTCESEEVRRGRMSRLIEGGLGVLQRALRSGAHEQVAS